MRKPLLVVLTGPTGVGKTELSIQLANYFTTEIISADSRQFYREMKIGTATPTPEQLDRIPHHFIGHISIHEYYNASMFEEEVMQLLEKLFHEYPLVILTGGSGLYIDAVVKGIDELPTIDMQLRNELISKHRKEGIEGLLMMLKKLDPEFYANADLRNYKRILKALEVSIMTGKPYSSHLKRKAKQRFFDILKICLYMNRDELYNRINRRVDNMLEEGLEDEARQLYPFKGTNPLNTVGYKELFSYFEGEIPREEAIRLIKRNSRHYARRQMTWFRRDNDYKWVYPFQEKEIMDAIQEKLQE
ncbi:MAG: tRNA (adenosine(37)-N6)-dimethylallyltransferase MiaA [Bacteroidota bacterium]